MQKKTLKENTLKLEKKYKVGTKTLDFYSGCNAPTFFRNLQKRSLAGG
jgi:hypothetical protein